jgi:hypothetical protein
MDPRGIGYSNTDVSKWLQTSNEFEGSPHRSKTQAGFGPASALFARAFTLTLA